MNSTQRAHNSPARSLLKGETQRNLKVFQDLPVGWFYPNILTTQEVPGRRISGTIVELIDLLFDPKHLEMGESTFLSWATLF